MTVLPLVTRTRPVLAPAPGSAPARPDADPRTDPRAGRRLVVGLMAGGLANFALLYYVQPLLPELATHFGVGAGTSAQVLSVATCAMAVGLLVIAPVADRFGRVRVMRATLLTSGLLGLASAWAPTWGSLLTLRALAGVALAGLPALAIAHLRDRVPADSHASANAAYIMGTAVGGALGRLAPGPLAALGGWTTATLVLAGVTLAASVALWVLVPDGRARTASPATPHPRPVASGGLLAVVRDPVVAALCLVGFATMGTFVGVYNAVAFRLDAAPFLLGHAATLVYLAYPVGIVAPWAARVLVARVGRPRAVATGVVLLAAGVLLTVPDRLPLVVAGLGVLTFAFLGTHSLVSGWAVDRAHRRGLSTTRASSSYLLAYYVGSAVLGLVATHRWSADGWTGVWTTSATTAAVALVAVVLAGRADRPVPATAGSHVEATAADAVH